MSLPYHMEMVFVKNTSTVDISKYGSKYIKSELLISRLDNTNSINYYSLAFRELWAINYHIHSN